MKLKFTFQQLHKFEIVSWDLDKRSIPFKIHLKISDLLKEGLKSQVSSQFSRASVLREPAKFTY
jgi:hypothetical protein